MNEKIVKAVKTSIAEILPDIQVNDLDYNLSLKDYGANSIDRTDIVVRSMELLNCKAGMMNFAGVKNINGIIAVLEKILNDQL